MGVTKTTAFSSKEEELLQELRWYKAAYEEAASRADIASRVIQKQREKLAALRRVSQGSLRLFPLRFPFQFVVDNSLFLFKQAGSAVEPHCPEGVWIVHTYTFEEDTFSTSTSRDEYVCKILVGLLSEVPHESAAALLFTIFSSWEQL